MKIMKKYLAVAKLSLQEELFYRTNFFFFFLRQSLWFLVEILLWTIVFQQKKIVADYNYSQIIQYFLIIYLTNLIVINRADYYLGDLIRSGNLSHHLLRPYRFFWMVFAHLFGRRLYRLFYVIGVLALVLFLGLVKISLVKLLVFIIILVNAALLVFLFRFLLGTVAFWLVNITSVFWLYRQLGHFLGEAGCR